MSEPAGYQRATFTNVSVDKNKPILIQFNPASLQYTVQNTLKEGKGKKKKQYVSQSTGKLTMDLMYDTTHSGEDVRGYTEAVAKLMEPVKANDKAPPVVLFEWGAYKFQGMMEGYKETIDFFSGDGVPLRAAINVTISKQDDVFDESAGGGADTAGSLSTDPVDAVELPQGDGDSAASAAAMGGDPRAARGIGAANGLASLRFSAGASLVVDASVSLGGPVAFASGGAGIGIGIGISGGISGGVSASAGISASAGAFAGLRASSSGVSTVSIRTDRLIGSSGSAGIASDEGASFKVGGQASVKATAGLNTDVGVTSSLRASIQFED